MLVVLYQYRLVMWAVYRYRLGNVGRAVSIEVRQCWMGFIDIG